MWSRSFQTPSATQNHKVFCGCLSKCYRNGVILCCWTKCVLSRNIPAMILRVCLSICVPLWAKSCTLIKLISWICVWTVTWGILLPSIHHHWDSTSHWYSVLFASLHVERKFISIYLHSWQCGQLGLRVWCLTLMFVTHRISVLGL